MRKEIMNIKVLFDDEKNHVIFKYDDDLEDPGLGSKQDVEDCLYCLKYTILDAVKEHGFVFDD